MNFDILKQAITVLDNDTLLYMLKFLVNDTMSIKFEMGSSNNYIIYTNMIITTNDIKMVKRGTYIKLNSDGISLNDNLLKYNPEYIDILDKIQQ